jgi:hypothetical protein
VTTPTFSRSAADMGASQGRCGTTNAEWTGIDQSVKMIRPLRTVYPIVASGLYDDAHRLPFRKAKTKFFARVF